MRHQLTKKDIEKIQEEIDHRRIVVRQELLQSVKEARAHGDLSENFEYHAAKKEKNQNESRIRYLERLLRTAVVVEDNHNADRVGLNTKVSLLYEDGMDEETFAFVTDVLADSLNNRLSIESPMYHALKGHKKGDRVLVEVNPEVSYYVRIDSVEPFEDTDIDINRF